MKNGKTAFVVFPLLVLVGCARKPAPKTAPIAGPGAGRSSYQFLEDPNAPRPNLEPDERFIPPVPIGALDLPSYPDEALRGAAEPTTIAVRIVVDPEGNVRHVSDSPLLESSAGPWTGLFRSAVEEVVRRWRFTPGEIRKLAPGKDLDGDLTPDYKIAVSQTFVPVQYDVRFRFEIVHGAGRVEQAPSRMDRL